MQCVEHLVVIELRYKPCNEAGEGVNIICKLVKHSSLLLESFQVFIFGNHVLEMNNKLFEL